MVATYCTRDSSTHLRVEPLNGCGLCKDVHGFATLSRTQIVSCRRSLLAILSSILTHFTHIDSTPIAFRELTMPSKPASSNSQGRAGRLRDRIAGGLDRSLEEHTGLSFFLRHKRRPDSPPRPPGIPMPPVSKQGAYHGPPSWLRNHETRPIANVVHSHLCNPVQRGLNWRHPTQTT